MSTLAILNDLTPVFAFFGGAGLILAIAGAVVALGGVIIRSGAYTGLGVCIWIFGAILSSAFLFDDEWFWLLVASLSTLPAALLIGGGLNASRFLGVVGGALAIPRSALLGGEPKNR